MASVINQYIYFWNLLLKIAKEISIFLGSNIDFGPFVFKLLALWNNVNRYYFEIRTKIFPPHV